MLALLYKVVAFIVAISILVAVHEFGHFWVARRLGFKVLRFSIGFGRPLLRWMGRGKDPVEYWLSALPLGGYVKLLDEREGPVEPAERHRAFNRRPIPQRIAVLLAGPLFNFLFAIVAYWAMFVAGVTGLKPIVWDVEPGTVAAESGLLAEDEIVSVGGHAVSTWQAATLAMLDEILSDGLIELDVKSLNGRPRDVVLDVRGRASELTRENGLFSGLGIQPQPSLAPIIDSVVEGDAAASAGLQAGDRIMASDGTLIPSWSKFLGFIQSHAGQSVVLSVERSGDTVSVPITIGTSTDADGKTVGHIGAYVRDTLPPELTKDLVTEQRFGPLRAFTLGAGQAWEMSALTGRMLVSMVTGKVSVRNVSGPITIGDIAGESAQAGLASFLNFLAVVSISLGILNLLPVPLLDGGQIVFQVAEGIKGTPLSERAMLFGQQIGLLFFIVLTGFVIFNDLSRIFG